MKGKKAAELGGGSGAPERETERRIRLAMVVQVVDRVLEMRLEPIEGRHGAGLPINDQIREVVLKSNRKFSQTYGQYSKALMHILEFWHSDEA